MLNIGPPCPAALIFGLKRPVLVTSLVLRTFFEAFRLSLRNEPWPLSPPPLLLQADRPQGLPGGRGAEGLAIWGRKLLRERGGSRAPPDSSRASFAQRDGANNRGEDPCM